MAPSLIQILIVLIILVAVIGVVVAIRRGQVRATMRLAPLVEDVRAMLTSLCRQLGEMADDGRVGARQAVADAATCRDGAQRLVADARSVSECDRARLLVQYGLSFLRVWSPRLADIEAVPSAAWCGRVTARHVSGGQQSLVVSDGLLDETPYHHPGGMVAGLAVPAGWYSRPIWSGALGRGVWSREDFAAFSAVFGRDVDTSGFHSGFDPRMPYGYVLPPIQQTRGGRHLLRLQLATMRHRSFMSTMTGGRL